MQRTTVDNGVQGQRRTRVAGVVALAVAALLLASPAIVGAEDPEPISNIEITQVDSSTQDHCLPGPLVLSYRKSNTDTFFELVVKASAPPCQPIEAKAVIYAMPGNGEAWPQTLVEVVPFTISRAGRTTIRFTKTCEPMQFDVITGAAPAEIAPWGEWHGPLLFPFDMDTALQHWGWDCNVEPTTTTTEPADTTTTTTATVQESTTVPTEVGGISEDRDPGSPDAEVQTEVAGVTEVQGSTASRDGSRLAYTGSNTSGPVAAGLALAFAGMILLAISRRRGALQN